MNLILSISKLTNQNLGNLIYDKTVNQLLNKRTSSWIPSQNIGVIDLETYVDENGL